METMNERFKALRLFRGMAREQLAEQVGISVSAVQKLENGGADSSKYLIEICDALDCDPRWLKLNKGQAPAGLLSGQKQIPEGSVPLIDWSQTIKWIDKSLRKTIDITETVFPPVSHKEVTPNMFALRIKGDSMLGTPKSFNENSIVIVDPDAKIENNKYVIVIKQMAQEAILRKLVIEGGEKDLVPLNTRYPMTPVDNKFKILGVVKWHADEV